MTELEREDDGYQDLIMDENERRKLQSYNINKEMKINTTRVSRWVVGRRAVTADHMLSLRKLDDNLLCRCEGHKTQRCSELCTKVACVNME